MNEQNLLEIEQSIRNFIDEKTQLKIKNDENFLQEIGSLNFVELLVKMHEEFQLNIDFSNVEPSSYTTINGFIQTIRANNV